MRIIFFLLKIWYGHVEAIVASSLLIFFGGFVWVEAQTLQTINYPDTIDTFANSPQYPEKKIATNTISATENDTLTYFIITKIDVSGNKRTRYPIIVRELDFKTGDTLKRSNFEERIKENRNQIFNTGLFNDVSIKISGWQGYNIQLIIDVEERWYIYPMPIFQLTDRNFNVWWKGETGKPRDLRRTEYGIKFIDYNFRGRRERLAATAQFGFTKIFELGYRIAAIDKAQTLTIVPSVAYHARTETAVNAANNALIFYRHDNYYIWNRFRGSIELRQRKSIHESNTFNISYYHHTVEDSLKAINSNFLGNALNKQQYISLFYAFTSDHRDIWAYPLDGYYFRLHIGKDGIGLLPNELNLIALNINGSYYKPFGKKWYGAVNLRAKLSFPEVQPFILQNGLGYGADYVRGHEQYVINGQHFLLGRTSLRLKLFDLKIKNNLIKLRQLRTIPVSLLLKIYTETAYVRDPFAQLNNNSLANKWLHGSGLGLDVFSFYDNVLSLEYTYNTVKDWRFAVTFSLNY